VCPKHIVSKWRDIVRSSNVSSEFTMFHTCQKINKIWEHYKLETISDTKINIYNDSFDHANEEIRVFYTLKNCCIYRLCNNICSVCYFIFVGRILLRYIYYINILHKTIYIYIYMWSVNATNNLFTQPKSHYMFQPLRAIFRW
jgi:hypothetical protein